MHARQRQTDGRDNLVIAIVNRCRDTFDQFIEFAIINGVAALADLSALFRQLGQRANRGRGARRRSDRFDRKSARNTACDC